MAEKSFFFTAAHGTIILVIYSFYCRVEVCFLRYSEYFERKTHGTVDFPFAFYDVTPRHPQYNMPLHWHSEYEIIRVISGRFELSINGRHIQLEAGEYAFIGGGLLHGGTPFDCRYQCMVFHMEFFTRNLPICPPELGSIQMNELLLPERLTAGEEKYIRPLREAFEAMARSETSPAGRLLAVGDLCRFFALILEDGRCRPRAGISLKVKKKITQYKKVLSYIEEHYAEKITLDELAGCLCMNKNYFCKFFYDLTQRSPVEYLNYYRIETACGQLLRSDKTITEVALDCGFSDVSYFIKVFKKYKGVTPSQYEAQARQDAS